MSDANHHFMAKGWHQMADVAGTTERDEALADVPESIREAARRAPDHWFGMVDPAWRAEDAPPHWAVIGQYRSDAEGEVVEWRFNEDYRPSPSANGWPPPTDPVDEAIQLAATGYGPEDDVFRLLADAEVGVLLAPDGSPLIACSPDGAPVVPVFTSDPQIQAGGRYATRTAAVRELVRALGEDVCLYVNPAGAVSMSVDPAQLTAVTGQPADADAVASAAAQDAEPDTDAPREGEPSATPPADSTKRVGRAETHRLPEPGPANAVFSTQDHLVNILSGNADDRAR